MEILKANKVLKILKAKKATVVSRAIELESNKKWDAARNVWEEALRKNPNSQQIEVWTGHARCCVQLKEFADAETSIDKALELNPDYNPAQILAAKVAAQQGKWPTAVKMFRRVMETETESKTKTNAKIDLIGALAKTGEFKEANDMLSALLAASPKNEALLQLRLLLARRRGDLAAVRKEWTTLATEFPEKIANSVDYLRFFGSQDEVESNGFSLKNLAGAGAAEAKSIMAYQQSRLTKGDYLAVMRNVAAKFPDDPFFESNLIRVLTANIINKKELDEAVTRATIFADKYPKHRRQWQLLVDAKVMANDFDGVRQLVENAERKSGTRTGTDKLRIWLAAREGDYETVSDLSRQIKSRQYFRATDGRDLDLRLQNAEPKGPFSDKILFFTSVRNEREYVPWLLDYYRSIGVDWFFFVDNNSTDGTAEFLASQKDVTVFLSSDQFLQKVAGISWMNELIRRYGNGNWCIHVDADEQLIVPGLENGGLRPFLNGMEERGEKIMPAFMLDTYPEDASNIGQFGAEKDPLVFSNLIDPEHFFFGLKDGGFYQVRGGVRTRLFGTREILEKTPIFRGDPDLLINTSHKTFSAKVSSQAGVVLHHKILRDALEMSKSDDDKQVRVNGRQALCRVRHEKYRDARYHVDDSGIPKGDNAIKFQNSLQLIDLGLMGPVSDLTSRDAVEMKSEYLEMDIYG